jgi:hypothetical protein
VHLATCKIAYRKATSVPAVYTMFLPASQAELALTEKREDSDILAPQIPKLLEDKLFRLVRCVP